MISLYYGVLTMKILLINNNPLVSRMLALCTRDEDIVLDEVKSVDAIGEVAYDLLFVDDGSYVDQIDALFETGKIRKKVFLSFHADDMQGFDETIKKPFLPSQIINIIENVDMDEVFYDDGEKHSIFPMATEENDEVEEVFELPDIFPLETEDEEEIEEEELEIQMETLTEVLNTDEIDKIKALLEMDDEEPLEELLSEDDHEARKVEVIKEQLIADGLEIVEEEEILDALSVKHKEKPADKRKKSKLKSKEKSKKEKKKKKKTSKFTKDELVHIEDAVALALESLEPKKMKRLLKGKEIEFNIKLEDND